MFSMANFYKTAINILGFQIKLVSCFSSCEYVRIRPNSGWNSVSVKTILCYDGFIGPGIYRPTSFASSYCMVVTPLPKELHTH
jgi:hypothetical protein